MTTTSELTYPLGAAARLTGLTPDLLRAWERRYEAVRPLRTEGGTRRYRTGDLNRLRLIKEAVDRGHRIGRVAGLSNQDLRSLLDVGAEEATAQLEEAFAAAERLDAQSLRELLSAEFSTLGPSLFIRQMAAPLVRQVGERWAEGRLEVAVEHMTTEVLRSMLGEALAASRTSSPGPIVTFATPSGERHELGLRMAAVVARGAGATPLYLGAELPTDELMRLCERDGTDAIVMSIVTLPRREAQALVLALSEGVSRRVPVWLGGAGAHGLDAAAGIEVLGGFEDLELRIAKLRSERVEDE